MLCERKSIKSHVYKYEPGKNLEDGFEKYEKVITNGYVDINNLIVLDNQCPYIKNRRGLTFIKEGDYVVQDEDGTRHVVGADKLTTRYVILNEDE